MVWPWIALWVCQDILRLLIRRLCQCICALLSRRNCTLKTSLVYKKSLIKQLSLLRIDDGNNVTEIEACLFVKPYLTKSFRIYFDLTRIYEMYACVGNHLCMVILTQFEFQFHLRCKSFILVPTWTKIGRRPIFVQVGL